MHAIAFIQNLAVLLLAAGLVTVLFHRLRQPVVLGYIVAGFLIGPHTPPFTLISDEQSIRTLAELGVIFLMFGLGLEFSLHKLLRVGPTAIIAAFFEIVLMIWLGYGVGRLFAWSSMDALFLGAILAISSTTIIVKALGDLKLKHERFAQLIFGVLIVEDILGIALIALLSGIAGGTEVGTLAALATLSRLLLFILVSLLLGLLLVPRILAYVARTGSEEMLLIVVLGLCFGFCLLVTRLGYSLVLGAFLSGAVMAETRQLAQIQRLVEPLRHLFSAIFFVAIGLSIDPSVLGTHAWAIAAISLAVLLGKILSCSFGAFVTGNDGTTSLRVGMGLAQIGEFSFIIAALGAQRGVTSDFLYPVAVAVSAITTLTTPYLIRAAAPLAQLLAGVVPARMARVFCAYGIWLRSLYPPGPHALLVDLIRGSVLHAVLNLSLVAAIFLGGGYFAAPISAWLGQQQLPLGLHKVLIWSAALLLSLPLLIAAYRRLKALSLLLAELGTHSAFQSRRVRRVLAELIPLLTLGSFLPLLAALSASILPPAEWLLVIGLFAVILLALLWRWFVRVHTHLHHALQETLDEHRDPPP